MSYCPLKLLCAMLGIMERHSCLSAEQKHNCRECCGDTDWTQQAARTSLASSAAKLQYDQVPFPKFFLQLQDWFCLSEYVKMLAART